MASASAREASEGRAETTDVDDIRALRDAVVALLYDPAYNDMTWAEIQAALNYAMVDVRRIFADYGSIDKAPPAKQFALSR